MNYTRYELQDIATSLLLKYRREITFRKDMELGFDIYILNTENMSYSVYISKHCIMLIAQEPQTLKQRFYLGVSTTQEVDEVNKAFDQFDAFIREIR